MKGFYYSCGLVLCAAACMMNMAHAQLISAFVREQSGTLPRGRFLVSFVSVSSSIDEWYGSNGVKNRLSQNLSQSISFQKIANDDSVRMRQLSGLFRSNEVNLSDQAGSLSGDLTGTVNGKIPVLGYGITDRLGVYVSIPILQFHLSSSYQFHPSESTKAFLSRLKANDQKSTATDFDLALSTSLEHKLYQSNYNWNPELDKTYLGDVQINFLQILGPEGPSQYKQSVQPLIVLPTATGKDIHDLYGLKAGNRRLGLGLKYTGEETFRFPLQLSFSLAGTYLLGATQGRRLPSSSQDNLNEYLDEATQVSGGASLQSQVQARYLISRSLGFNAGFLWQQELKENLEGQLFPKESYRLASENSERELLTTYASIDYSTIPRFLDGNFLFPALAEVGVGIPLRGKNAIAEPVLELQGTLFF